MKTYILHSWVKRNQLDATYFIIYSILIQCSTCFGPQYDHLQESATNWLLFHGWYLVWCVLAFRFSVAMAVWCLYAVWSTEVLQTASEMRSFAPLYVCIYIRARARVYQSANINSAMTGCVSKAWFIFVQFAFHLKPDQCLYSIIGVYRICRL